MAEIVVGVGTAGPATTRAVRWAAERARARGTRLHLVNVVDQAIAAAGDAELVLAAETKANACLSEAADIVASVLSSGGATAEIEVVSELVPGDPVEVFDQLSRDAELLVVGSDWHGGRRPSRRGVHSLRIAAASHAPVAVVPDIDVSERRGVAVGVDGSVPGAAALEFAASEAIRLGQPLVAVHAWDIAVMVGGEYGYGVAMVATDDLTRAANEVLDGALAPVEAAHPELEIERQVIAGDPVLALADAAAEAALLVVGSHGRGAWARFLLGSVSHGVLAHLEGPVVIVR